MTKKTPIRGMLFRKWAPLPFPVFFDRIQCTCNDLPPAIGCVTSIIEAIAMPMSGLAGPTTDARMLSSSFPNHSGWPATAVSRDRIPRRGKRAAQ
jgi:hypothetical protein